MIENISVSGYFFLIAGIFFVLGVLAHILNQRVDVEKYYETGERTDWFSRLYVAGILLMMFCPTPKYDTQNCFDYVFIFTLILTAVFFLVGAMCCNRISTWLEIRRYYDN